MVGSTPLSTRFDPEDLREIVGAYHRCVTNTVGRFGGFVAKYMGDGVLVYFGYPEAHEDVQRLLCGEPADRSMTESPARAARPASLAIWLAPARRRIPVASELQREPLYSRSVRP